MARLELPEAEKALTQPSDERARRKELPWVRIDKEYRFETYTQAPRWQISSEGVRSCSSITSCSGRVHGGISGLLGDRGRLRRLRRRVPRRHPLRRVAGSPLAKLQAYKCTMGWSFPWASSFGGDVNHDFQVAQTKALHSGVREYNFPAVGGVRCGRGRQVPQEVGCAAAPARGDVIIAHRPG